MEGGDEAVRDTQLGGPARVPDGGGTAGVADRAPAGPAGDPASGGAASARRPVADDGRAAPAPADASTAGVSSVTSAPPGPRTMTPPPLAGRITYLFGGTLPSRYSAWVARDLTAPGWRLRQALRPMAVMLPFAIVFAVLPGQVGIRILLVSFLLLAAGGLGLATSGHFRNRRLVQHGFPPIFPAADEDERDDERRRAASPAGATASPGDGGDESGSGSGSTGVTPLPVRFGRSGGTSAQPRTAADGGSTPVPSARPGAAPDSRTSDDQGPDRATHPRAAPAGSPATQPDDDDPDGINA